MATIKTFKQIQALQKQYKVTGVQEGITSGQCWHMEGAQGRFASECLTNGVCVLPTVQIKDYYGNTVPSRNDLKPGTKGTLGNACNFWQKVVDGDSEARDYLEDCFGHT
jgi:hypothetical protein